MPAVLVRATSTEGVATVLGEMAALERAAGAGVVKIIDVIDDGARPALLIEHVRGVGLGTLMGLRDRWTAGEAVGVLGPLAGAVARMHRAGVACGGLRGSEVLLSDGGPVIVDMARADLITAGLPEVELARVESVGADRDALRAVSLDVLARVSGGRAAAASALAESVMAVDPWRLCAALESGLSELAAPMRIVEPAPSRDTDTSDAATPRPAPGDDALNRPRALVRRLWAVLAIDRLRDIVPRIAPRRRRLVVGGAAAVAVAAFLMSVLPDPESRVEPGFDPPATPGGEHPAAVAEGDLESPDPVMDEDPIVAAVALLDQREECFRELSMLCLETVDQAGSAALGADRAAISGMIAGDESSAIPRPAGEVRVVERLGDAALLAFGPETAPASLLLMRSEAGWRIRDWVAEP
ncbi:hypothetical protein [Homoserinibacter sp. GY 40078]|uniref:hypothetical protein n=1 Tax=Homoserinibacter sp. GY 40078 TaxID=2603275 RepID=UPI0011C71C7D|nr:hypothetical protein [Homoserinibacter sp. GY 40078]TXK17473.1 hypothetical protein FVQ89_11650 [Homoserinibacter sp. GY 40078]